VRGRTAGRRTLGLAMTSTTTAPTTAPAAASSAASPRTPRTYDVRTYGCQMNVHDSERLSGLLEDAGYTALDPEADRDTADVVVFNTCAVRENADNKLYGNLGHLAPVKKTTSAVSRSASGSSAV